MCHAVQSHGSCALEAVAMATVIFRILGFTRPEARTLSMQSTSWSLGLRGT
jgi:hypothetical protein